MITLTLGQVCVGTRTFKCRYVPHNMSNQRMHWAVKKKWTDAWKLEVESQVMLQRSKLGNLPLPHASVVVILKVCKLMDYDGAYSSVKPLLDALKAKDGAGIIIDDSPKYIDLVVKQEQVKHLKDQGVTITISQSLITHYQTLLKDL